MNKIAVRNLEHCAEHIGDTRKPRNMRIVLQQAKGFIEHGASEHAENQKQQKSGNQRKRVRAAAAHQKKAGI